MFANNRSLGPALGVLLVVFGVLVIALPHLLVWIVGLTMIMAGVVLLLGALGPGWTSTRPARYRRV